MTVGRIDVLCEGVSGVEIVKVGFDNMSPSELFRLSGLVHTTGEVGNIPLNELMRQAFSSLGSTGIQWRRIFPFVSTSGLRDRHGSRHSSPSSSGSDDPEFLHTEL